MKRRQVFTSAFALVLLPGASLAQTAEDQVINQLKRQGYNRITLGRTLLGRTQIIANGPSGRREIILNPSTGAILRDYIDRSGRDDDKDDRDDRQEDRDDREKDRNDDNDDDRDDREDDDDDRDDDDRDDDDRDDRDDDDDDDRDDDDDDD